MDKFMRWVVMLTLVLAGARAFAAEGDAPTNPPQIPLCMIGDSITWAGEGDYWRADLLEHLPSLAFVGTHSAVLGYAHAGEGGNGTAAVLARVDAIPDCPYYHLLIGTNDNGVRDPAVIPARAAATAQRIVAIVNGLLSKPHAKIVFLGSILPCHTDNPLRDEANSAVNAILREKLGNELPAGKVVWVEYEQPIRATPNWEPMILLHPTQEGYKLIAKILADRLIEVLKPADPTAEPAPVANTGVRIVNLMGDDDTTRDPVIAGWYMLSFKLVSVDGSTPAVVIQSVDVTDEKRTLNQTHALVSADAGNRMTIGFFTGYEGYNYQRARLRISATDATIADVLLEKKRPSGEASMYGVGTYIDATAPPALGELVVSSGE